MATPREKFQSLLRELFQFDCADLDFGIYRIMNHKRDTIERFVTEDLPKAIAGELATGTLADQSLAAKDLKETRGQITENFGQEALDADGRLAETYQGTPLGKKYLALQTRAAGGRDREALETNVFNHLYTFFGRYYQDGDFISKRRYSKRQKYAIPYNGEEVYLYWANNDQYYVKTGENFHDYTFSSHGVTVHFKLRAADIEQNNVKGDKRFFLPRFEDVEWDGQTKQLVVPFEYRPLTDREEIGYGKKNQQETIIVEALAEIPKRLRQADDALLALKAEKRKNADGGGVTFLEHHLRQYTRRNTSDFFIHKDLKGFLDRELDFYLKNEVLNLDEMEAAGEGRVDGWFQIMRVIKNVGGRIIEFLDQIESFQKMLWEKRKFITETQYCITVGNIDESFYPEIAECEPQWTEWKELLHIDEEKIDLFTNGKSKRDRRIAFLKGHPAIILDTKNINRDFNDRLMSTFDNLDELMDGLLINCENFQSLNFIIANFKKQIDCVYIDPPYNTDAGPILYKNDYRNSSWISLMADRLLALRPLLSKDGIICATIDDYQYKELHYLFERLFGKHSVAGTVAIRSNPSGRPVPSGFAQSHEYALFITPNPESSIGKLPRSQKQSERYKHTDQLGAYMWELFRKRGSNSERWARPSLYYPIYVAGESVRVPTMEWDDEKKIWNTLENPNPDEVIAYPIDENGVERRWRGKPTNITTNPTNYRAKIENNRVTIYYKFRPNSDGVLPTTMWIDAKYSATEHGTGVIKDLFTEYNIFSYPKSVFAVEDCLIVSGAGENSVIICDFFAGSGTTGHATINLNRIDGIKRKFVLVEVENHFDTVLLPRIKKVAFTPTWKDGYPERMASKEEAERGPRIVKYFRLESYEDALNNIEFDGSSDQSLLQFDDYLLKYMLRWETRKSETLLNAEKLSHPFNYKLQIHRDGQTREKVVDVPETFNYLLGLHIDTRRVYYDEDRRYLVYRGRIDHRTVAVIWRETDGWTKEDLERDQKFVADRKLTEGADEVFVNGDSFIPEAKALEPLFKARMFAPVEA